MNFTKRQSFLSLEGLGNLEPPRFPWPGRLGKLRTAKVS